LILIFDFRVEVGLGFWFFGFGEGFGGCVFALFEDESGAAEASKSVQSAHEVDGVLGELLLGEGFEDLADGELVGGLMELDDVVVLDEVGGVFAEEASFGDAVLVLRVKLETAVEPVGDVFAVERDAVFGHFDFDGFVGSAVVEHLVDEVALGFGEFGDFAGGFAGIFDFRFLIFDF